MVLTNEESYYWLSSKLLDVFRVKLLAGTSRRFSSTILKSPNSCVSIIISRFRRSSTIEWSKYGISFGLTRCCSILYPIVPTTIATGRVKYPTYRWAKNSENISGLIFKKHTNFAQNNSPHFLIDQSLFWLLIIPFTDLLKYLSLFIQGKKKFIQDCLNNFLNIFLDQALDY